MIRILILFTFLSVSISFAAPKEVVAVLSDFAKEMRGVQQRYIVATNRLPQQYILNLQSMEKKYKGDGALDELLAVRGEIKRFKDAFAGELDPFETVPEMPEDAIVEAPDALIELQQKYIEDKENLLAKYEEDSESCAAMLVERIEGFERELTKKDKIEEAMLIRDERLKIQEAIDSGMILDYLKSVTLTGGRSKPNNPAVITGGHGSASGDDSGSTRTSISGWRRWTLDSKMPFSPDYPKLFSIDIQSPVMIDVVPSLGKFSFQADAGIPPKQIGASLCTWFGSSALWCVRGGQDLSVNIKVESRKQASDERSGPHFFVYVLSDKDKQLALFRIPLIRNSYDIKIVRDSKDPARYAVWWPAGRMSRPFNIDPAEEVKLAIGVALSNPRESCDVTVRFE